MEALKTTRTGEHSMFLRLVLVGMVAAMGVTIPSRWGCEHWFNSAGAWASSTLADWDTWSPSDAQGGSHKEIRQKTECPECRLARERARLREQNARTASRSEAVTAASGAIAVAAVPRAAELPAASAPVSSQQKTVTLQPIQVARDFASGIASVLDGLSEGRQRKETPAVSALAPPLAAETIVATENFELALLGELFQEAERAANEGRRQPAPAEPRVDVATADDSWICGDITTDFGDAAATSLATTEATSETWNEPLANRPPATISEREPDLCLGFEFGVERNLDLAQPVPSSPVTPRVAALPDLPSDVFARPAVEKQVSSPKDLSKTQPAIKLVDLPRDVFARPARTVVIDRGQIISVKVPDSRWTTGQDEVPGKRLGHAVQLTRDAVFAWISVLTKPGVADVARR